MPSFKIVLNLFIIFINKFNDSINMIYCAIFYFLLFIYIFLSFFILSHDIHILFKMN